MKISTLEELRNLYALPRERAVKKHLPRPDANGLLALTHGGTARSTEGAVHHLRAEAPGFVTVIALSMFGIGALLMTSLVWLTVMKWVGGAYLVWLGIEVWRSPPIGPRQRPRSPVPGRCSDRGALRADESQRCSFSLLPQFIDPVRSLSVQFVIMAGTFPPVGRVIAR